MKGLVEDLKAYLEQHLDSIHLVLLIVWILLLIPTVTVWRDSVLWVGYMSIYAIWFIHIDGFSAARSARRKKR